MIIRDIRLYYFRLPFVSPVRVGSRMLSFREGFLVRLGDDAGRFGYGEAAPLPGLDDASLEDCRKELRGIARKIHEGRHEDIFFPQPSPVVRFGLESARLALATAAVLDQGCRIKKTGGAKSGCNTLETLVNGLFIPDPDSGAVQRQVDRLLESGFSTIKIKIGRIPMKAEFASIRYLAGRAGPFVNFRLDANRLLSLDRYKRYFRELRDLPVEYVEEPLEAPDFERAGDAGWPLALDESLPLYWDARAGAFTNLPASVTRVVVKPATPAGFSDVIRHFSETTNTGGSPGVLPVLSSAFNSVYGIASLILHIQQVPAASGIAHGLDTGSFMGFDLVCNGPRVKNGRISVPADILWNPESPDFSKLQEVDP